MNPTPTDDIVQLTTAPNPADAHIWRQALEAEDIQCHVVGDYLNAGYGDIPGLKAEVWVHKKDLERAREVLSRGQPLAEDEDVEVDSEGADET
jgi:Putative prokaryotic signal transducing protein